MNEFGWDCVSDQELFVFLEEVVKVISWCYEEVWVCLIGGYVFDEVSDEMFYNEVDDDKYVRVLWDSVFGEFGDVVLVVFDVFGELEFCSVDKIGVMLCVVVEVMLKFEILDFQGKVIMLVFVWFGYDGLMVCQGKCFEIIGEGLEDCFDEICQVVFELLVNIVIEFFDVYVED